MDFSKYKFRASQASKLLVGTIRISKEQAQEIKDLEQERDTGINANRNKVKWTHNKQVKYDKLVDARDNPKLPKTVETELRKIHRSERYNRNFEFTNKYVQKGIHQEREAITHLQAYLNNRGIKVFFKDRKEEELTNGTYFRGTPDTEVVELVLDGKKLKVGFDTKCSWELATLPYPEDPLDPQYDAQNRVYMKLTGADMWITAYVLVNCTEQLLYNEKQKFFYAMGSPEQYKEPEEYAAYIKKAKGVEKQLVFDWDRFVSVYPHHILEYKRKEWMDEENDIPLEKRVVLKPTYPNEKIWAEMEERAIIGRQYLQFLEEQDQEPVFEIASKLLLTEKL